MIALLRRMIAYRSQATGRTVQSIYQEVVEVIRGQKIPYPGDRPQCRICNSERTMVDRTAKDGGLVIRYHHCDFCGVRFQTVEEVDPALLPPPPPPGKSPDPATTPPCAEHKESRGKRKRKRG